MYKIFYVFIIIFMFGCNHGEVQTCYDEGIVNTEDGERYSYFCKIDSDYSPIDHDGRMCKNEEKIYNELADKCIFPICDDSDVDCIQGCTAKIDGVIFRIYCSID